MISLVAPAYNEAGNLARLAGEIASALSGEAYELIVVDDGSADGTWKEIQALAAADARVRGVRLTRNFGHQPAILAGLAAAAGDAVITLDADGQHPPEVIPELIAKWRAGDRVVQAVRTTTEGEGLLKRWTSRMFYRLLGRSGGPAIPAGSADFRLLDREVVRTVIDSLGPLVFLRGLVPWLGYPTAYVPFAARKRRAGETSYTMRQMLRFSLHGLMSFTIVPLRISIVFGFLVAGLSFLYLIVVLASWVFIGRLLVQGWASVMGLLSLFAGIQLITIGVLGEYVGRLFIGALNRPHFVVLDRTAETGQAAAQSR